MVYSDPSPQEPRGAHMLEELQNQQVVVDLRSEYVSRGPLLPCGEQFLELKNADLHDLRDTDTTRENYVADSCRTGIKRNRKRVLLCRSDMVAIARLEDVVDE